MKTLILLVIMACAMSAQNSDPPAAAKAVIAAQIEQARVFAERAVADPGLIERTAKANRAKILNHTGAQVLEPSVSETNHTAEMLYQIQEDLGLPAAIRAAQLLAGLPTLSKRKK